MEIKIPRKLIEVALPLDAINIAAGKEKSIRHGHPSTLHLWWARRPLAAARAIIFAQMVNDPGYERHLGRGLNKEKAAMERERLFGIMERLVLWENTNNESVLKEAREEIRKSWRETCALNKNHPQAGELFNPDKLPAFHDPFAGGGALPLEAQRLGLEAWSSDLNPVAVTINKAMIEIPPKFSGRAPVGPLPVGERQSILIEEDWSGNKGLAEDVRRYGRWMRDEAEKRIGYLYPKIEINSEMTLERSYLKPNVGEKMTVIAWLWARTVKSPNPAFSHVEVPLMTTFVLSLKSGKEAYVEPIIEGENYRFKVKEGIPPRTAKNGTKLARGANFQCLLSGVPISSEYIKAEGMAGRIGVRMIAIVAEGERGRIYISPTVEHESVVNEAKPDWKPEVTISGTTQYIGVLLYGMSRFDQLFTPRQTVALTTFSNLVHEVVSKVFEDAVSSGLTEENVDLESGGSGALAYAQAIGVYLALAVSRISSYWSNLTSHDTSREKITSVFARQVIPMVWDFMEGNPFSTTSGNFLNSIEAGAKSLIQMPNGISGMAVQADAAKQGLSQFKVVSTDPPYYDNVPYADISDFFYVWLRKSLKSIFPHIYATVAVPKAEELVAFSYRHGSKDAARLFFLDEMTKAIQNLAQQSHPAFPVTIYYAFKQTETKEEVGTSSTGWQTFLEAVLRAGFSITGTWPMRTEMKGRALERSGTNVLASSIVLVCQKRSINAPDISRRDFIRELNAVLPEAMDEMTRGGVNSPVAPVDLSQAIIGPGMAIFSKYSAVLEADGNPMSVRTALQLINRFLAEDDFDQDTQFCLQWFESFGWAEGQYGEAEVLSKSKGISTNGLQTAGVIASGGGKFRLLRWGELPSNWLQQKDSRTPVWEALHQLIRVLNQDGEQATGALLAKMPSLAEPIRALAYRMYTLCERKGWAEEARAYNELIGAWSGVESASLEVGHVGEQFKFDM
jgi:putative DNA methylase